jgi:hypothetical protein
VCSWLQPESSGCIAAAAGGQPRACMTASRKADAVLRRPYWLVCLLCHCVAGGGAAEGGGQRVSREGAAPAAAVCLAWLSMLLSRHHPSHPWSGPIRPAHREWATFGEGEQQQQELRQPPVLLAYKVSEPLRRELREANLQRGLLQQGSCALAALAPRRHTHVWLRPVCAACCRARRCCCVSRGRRRWLAAGWCAPGCWEQSSGQHQRPRPLQAAHPLRCR